MGRLSRIRLKETASRSRSFMPVDDNICVHVLFIIDSNYLMFSALLLTGASTKAIHVAIVLRFPDSADMFFFNNPRRYMGLPSMPISTPVAPPLA